MANLITDKARLFLLFLLGVGLILSCGPTPNALRIKLINEGRPLIADTRDIFTLPGPEGEEEEEVEATPDYVVRVDVVYTELGAGLPTWPGPYTAKITDYKVEFSDITPGLEAEERMTGIIPVIGSCNFLVPSDPDGRLVVINYLKVLPAEWIEFYGDEFETKRMLKAKLTLKGKDELMDKDVEDVSYFTIDITDYADDPKKRGE